MIRKICPDCHRVHGFADTRDAEKLDILTLCCPECHAERVRRIHALETSDGDGYDQSPVDGKYQPPYERHVRPSSSGRRVVRKSEPMAG